MTARSEVRTFTFWKLHPPFRPRRGSHHCVMSCASYLHLRTGFLDAPTSTFSAQCCWTKLELVRHWTQHFFPTQAITLGVGGGWPDPKCWSQICFLERKAFETFCNWRFATTDAANERPRGGKKARTFPRRRRPAFAAVRPDAVRKMLQYQTVTKSYKYWVTNICNYKYVPITYSLYKFVTFNQYSWAGHVFSQSFWVN
jgi:hypothetical protein